MFTETRSPNQHAHTSQKLAFSFSITNINNTNTNEMAFSSSASTRTTAMRSLLTALIALVAFSSIPTTLAHSWIEEFQVIDSNGSYIGDRGFPRGYMARTDPGYNGFSMNYLLPQNGTRISSSDKLCHPSQQSSNYTNQAYPKLQVTPGSYVAMKYLENGHVTLPWTQIGKPAGGGTVFVYGTTEPSNEEKIADVLSWTSDGKGGNGKGFLMTAQNYDDGRCHQINCGNISIDRQTLYPAHVQGQPQSSVEQWCETDLKIPESAAPGTLAVYWVWQWPTEPGKDCTIPDGKDEYYTTCSDFEVVAADGNDINANILAEADTHTLAQENPQSTAVADFKSRNAFTSSPAVIIVDGSKTIGQQAKVAATFASSCSATGNVKPGVTVPASCDIVSIFSGAPLASASQALKQFATTDNLAAPAAPTSVAAPSSTAAPASSAATSAPAASAVSSAPAASAPSSQSAAASGAITVTVTTTTTEATTLMTTITVNSPAGDSAAASSSPSTSAAAYSASSAPPTFPSSAPTYSNSSSSSLVYSMITTIYSLPGTGAASTSTPPTAPAASSPAPQPSVPTVGANGMVQENTARADHERRVEAHRRRHARSFQ